MSIFEKIGFKKHNNESDVAEMEPRTLNPEEQDKKVKLDGATEQLLKDIEQSATPEKLAKMTPEKTKLVIDKVKVLCLVGIALGISVAAKFYPELQAASDHVGTASVQAMLGGGGALFATVSAIMLGFRNVVNKERKSATVKA